MENSNVVLISIIYTCTYKNKVNEVNSGLPCLWIEGPL